MKVTLLFLGLFSILFLFQRCGNRVVVLAPQIENLIGTWKLVESDSSYAVTLVFALDTRNPPLDITPFLASGKSSVNEYNVRLFATIDGVMSAENLTNTQRSGTADAVSFEQTYFTNLKAVVRYEMIGQNRLRLQHGGSIPHVMIYEKIK